MRISRRELRMLLSEALAVNFETDGRVLIAGERKYKITASGFNLPLLSIKKISTGYEVTIKKPFVAGGGTQTGKIEGKELEFIQAQISNNSRSFSVDLKDPDTGDVTTIKFKKVS